VGTDILRSRIAVHHHDENEVMMGIQL